MVVSFAESAVHDLEEVLNWYSEQGVPDVGERSWRNSLGVSKFLSIIQTFEQSFLRELIEPPFRIVYRRDSNRIRVVRVWRSERRLHLPPDVPEIDEGT